MEEKRTKRILTGDRPTGPLHLGHYVGSLENRVRLQHDYETFILIADIQALTTNWEHPEKLSEDIRNVAMDYLAVGIDPDVATICVQSMIPDGWRFTIFGIRFVFAPLRRSPFAEQQLTQS